MRKFIFFISLGFLVFLFVIPPSVSAISFSINIDKQSFTKDEEIPIHIAITGLTSCTTCYLQAAFTALGTPKYFGQTQKNSGEWYKYTSSPNPTTVQTTFFSLQPMSGNWSGDIKAKVDRDDSDYNGEGQYLLKVIRYSGSSTTGSGSDSNELSLTIVGDPPTPTVTATPTNTPTPINTPTPTKTPTPTRTPTPAPTTKQASVDTSINFPTTKISPTTVSSSLQTATLASALNDTAETDISEKTRVELITATPEKKVLAAATTNYAPIFIGAGILLLSACGILVYRTRRKLYEED